MAPFCPHKRPLKGKRKYTAPELYSKWVEFASWVNAHPIMTVKKVVQKGQVIEYALPRPRPYLLSEFLRFAGVHKSTWKRWMQEREDLVDVVEDIEDMVREQKLIGAYSDQFNTTISYRDLGLSEKVEVKDDEQTWEEFLESLEEDRPEPESGT